MLKELIFCFLHIFYDQHWLIGLIFIPGQESVSTSDAAEAQGMEDPNFPVGNPEIEPSEENGSIAVAAILAAIAVLCLASTVRLFLL